MNPHQPAIDKLVEAYGERMGSGFSIAPHQEVWVAPDLWSNGKTNYVKCLSCGVWIDLHRDAWHGDNDVQYCFDHVVRDGKEMHKKEAA